MAKLIAMKNPKTGQTVDGFIGYSWTTLIFGAFPALFRSDFLTFIGAFVVIGIISAISAGIGGIIVMIIWSFMYNKYYTMNLIKKGYLLNGTHEENKASALELGIELTEHNCTTYAAQTKA